MGYAFKALFAFFTQLFSAAEKLASAGNHLATWADEAAGTFADKARIDRQADVRDFMKAAGITEFEPPAGKIKGKTKAIEVAA